MTHRLRARGQGQSWWKPVLLLGVVLILVILVRFFNLEDRMREIHHWIRTLGGWGPVVFTLIYTVGIVATLPASAMTLMAGAFFKPLLGIVVATLGSFLGTSIVFFIARYFARKDLERLTARNEKFKKLDQMTERHGALLVAMMRLMPLSPFSVLNYAFGLTKIRFWEYALWSCLCTLPSTILFVLGARAFIRGMNEGKVPWMLLGLMGIITLVLAILLQVVEKKLEKRDKKPLQRKS
jgi:uncharacterized membrane protein YdjX (TVP38/TMEM64 family)